MYSAFLNLCLFAVIKIASASTIAYNWNVGWTNANPDGRLMRPVIAINGQWPSPTITGNVGDTIIVNVNNNLGNETITLHWHGLFQAGNNANDGTPMVAQCPLIPGSSYTYTFTLAQPGTYWYHSHSSGQYMDGLRGPLIVHDPKNPYLSQYDSELVISVSDWYHDQAPKLIPYYLDTTLNPSGGSEPVPISALMNDQANPTFNVVAGKTYFLRIIKVSVFAQFYVHIDGHNFTIIEIDGVYVNPTTVKDLYIATGQRYGVLLKTVASSATNYAILGAMDTNSFDPGALSATPNQNPNVTGALVYNNKLPIPLEAPTVSSFNVIDDFTLVPQDGMLLLQAPSQQFVLALDFWEQQIPGNSQYRSGFNNVSYIPQNVPSLYTAISAGSAATNPAVYGTNSIPLVLGKNNVIEIVINNYDGGPHPMHIHGHNVQIVARGPGIYSQRPPYQRHVFRQSGNINAQATAFGFTNSSAGMRHIPMRRDTWMIAPNSYTVIRFVANNPGVWFLHCHMEWHMEAGLLATIVEDPLSIQASQGTIPSQMQSICKSQNIPLLGNAAGNSQNYTNLTGQNTIAPYPKGALYP